MQLRTFWRWVRNRCLVCGSKFDEQVPHRHGYLWHCPTCKRDTAWTEG